MGDINTSQSFSAGDLVTDTKLNNIAQLSVLSTSAITEKSEKSTAPSASDRLLIFESSSNQLKKISTSNLINLAPLTQSLPAGTSNTFGTSTFPQGNAASPSVRGAGATDSGLFWANGVKISAGGVERAHFSSASTTLAGPVSVSGSLTSNGGSTGASNTSFGASSLGSASSGSDNSAFGAGALGANTTGIGNVAVGRSALTANQSGQLNTAVGYSALQSNTSNQNTAIGWQALYNTTNSQNTAIGSDAGSSNTSGIGNTFIGSGAQGLTGSSNYTITLGNNLIQSLRCQAQSISSLSDRRDKKDIVSLASGLGLIQELRPVSFVWNMRDGGKVGQPEIGFIAQELQEAQAKSGLFVPHLVTDENPEKLEAAFATLIPVLVRAVQELSDKVRQLEQRLP